MEHRPEKHLDDYGIELAAIAHEFLFNRDHIYEVTEKAYMHRIQQISKELRDAAKNLAKVGEL